MEEAQKFLVEIDGVEKEAELVDVVDFKENRYAVYGVKNSSNPDNVDLYVSMVKIDENGFDTLVDVINPEVKNFVLDIIKEAATR